MKRILIAMALVAGTFIGASAITTTDGICQGLRELLSECFLPMAR
jgi:hypothetical protein